MLISPNNMLKALMVFGAGVYVGIYIDQKYQIPAVDDPQQLYEKFKKYIEQYRK